MSFFDEYIARTKEATISEEYGNLTHTDQIDSLLKVQGACNGITSVFGICALIMLAYFTISNKMRTKGQKQICTMVILHVCFMTLNSLTALCLTLIPTPESAWRICNILGTLPSTTYVAGNGLSYAIFLKRASASITISNRSKLGSYLWYFCIFGTYNIPGFIIIMWLLINGKIIYTDVCYQDHPWWLAMMFTTIDSSLSLAFLYLFIEPVWQQMKAAQASSIMSVQSKRMRATARKNLLWSSTTIMSTFIFMAMVSYTPQQREGAVRMATWIGQPIDALVNMIGTLAITSAAWLPKKNASRVTAASSNFNTSNNSEKE